MSKTYMRVFNGLGEQKIGHCRAVNHKHKEEMIKFMLMLAVININKALERLEVKQCQLMLK